MMLISAMNSLCAYISRELSGFRESICHSPIPHEGTQHHETGQPKKEQKRVQKYSHECRNHYSMSCHKRTQHLPMGQDI